MREHFAPMINGVRQHIWIRGLRRENPLVLLVHGGPGVPLMELHKGYFSGLEDEMTFVQWDQRGTCKSFSRHIPEASMNLQQFVDDAVAVAEFALRDVGQKQLVLWGTSWGSIIGLRAVLQQPAIFSAYIGVGQNVDMRRAEQLSYNFTLALAKQEHNAKALADLSGIRPPYRSLDEVKRQRKWLMRFGGFLRDRSSVTRLITRGFLASRDAYSPLDAIRFFQGQAFSLRTLMGEVMAMESFLAAIPEVPVPLSLLEGRYDYQCPAALVEEFFGSVQAPSGKELIWFEDSSHMPYVEENAKFRDVMRNIVRRYRAEVGG